MTSTDAAWIEAARQAQREHASIDVDAAAFDAHVARCRDRGARIEHVGDLFLAWSAGRGDAAALRALEAYVATDVTAAAQRVRRSSDFVAEVTQTVRVRVLVPEHGRVRIDDYAGRGPLRGWFGVAALRVALNLQRSAGPATEDVLAELVSSEADPELRHLKTLYRAEFKRALEAALEALSDRQRAVLRLCHVDGLKLAQLARLYQVHESTASRWVSQAAAAVADDARRRLVSRLSLSPSSVDSVARMVRSNLDVSIGRILRG